MNVKCWIVCLISLFLLLSATFAISQEEVVGDDPNTQAPPGSGITNLESTEEANSWITIQIIGSAPGMDEYRWYSEDFGWTHTFDPECKEIYDVTLTIMAWDVDYSDGERDAVYGDGVFLGYLQGSSDTWVGTDFVIPIGLLNDGELHVWVDIDATNSSSVWAVTIDYSTLRTHWDWVPPEADFIATPTSGVGPLLVCFTDLSTCADSWLWDFGDGYTSTEQNPCHVFQSDRKFYTVKLTVWGPGGEDSITKERLIVVHKEAEVSFNASPIVGPPELEVQFTNTSGGGTNHWIWDFGDGENAELHHDVRAMVHPIHVYSDAGEYNVSLTGWGNGGMDELMVPGLIYVDPDYLPLTLVDAGPTEDDRYTWKDIIDHDILSTNASVVAPNGDAWAVYKLDTLCSIHKIRVRANDALGRAFPNNLAKDFQIWVSTIDPELYMKVFEGTITKKNNWQVFNLEATANKIMLKIVSAQGENSPLVSLCEFQVFGKIVEEPVQPVEPTNELIAYESALPVAYSLAQNYPNPFNPETMIAYQLPEEADVILSIYNIRGQLISTLVNSHVVAGDHNMVWNGKDDTGNIVAGGIYIYTIRAINKNAETITISKKMTFMK